MLRSGSRFFGELFCISQFCVQSRGSFTLDMRRMCENLCNDVFQSFKISLSIFLNCAFVFLNVSSTFSRILASALFHHFLLEDAAKT